MWTACVTQVAGAVVGLSQLGGHKCNVIFVIDRHMFNHRIVLSWKGPTRIIEPNS